MISRFIPEFNREKMIKIGLQWGSGVKTHSLGGACSGHTGSELQLHVLYPLNSIKKFTETVIQ